MGTGFSGQSPSSRKTVRPRLLSNGPNGLQTLGDGTCIASFEHVKNADCRAVGWHGFFRTNSINTIVPKHCAPKICESFQTLGYGTCIASLAGSDAKTAELLARVFRTNSSNAIVRKNCAPKTCQMVSKRRALGQAWGKFVAGGFSFGMTFCPSMLRLRSLRSEAN